jgi:hypothetical protein
MRRIFLYSCFLFLLTVQMSLAETITLNLPEVEAEVGSTVEVPLKVEGAEQMVAWQLVLVHDPEKLQVIDAVPGKLLEDSSGLLEVNSDTPGRTWIASAAMQPIAGDGNLIVVRYEVIGQSGDNTELNIEKAEAWQGNETEILINTESGSIAMTDGGSLWWLLLAALLAAVILGLGLFALIRYKHLFSRLPQLQLPHAEPPTAGPPVAEPPTFHQSLQASHEKIVVNCPNCSRKLKAKLEMAGRKAVCVKCGEAMVIPPLAMPASMAT